MPRTLIYVCALGCVRTCVHVSCNSLKIAKCSTEYCVSCCYPFIQVCVERLKLLHALAVGKQSDLSPAYFRSVELSGNSWMASAAAATTASTSVVLLVVSFLDSGFSG